MQPHPHLPYFNRYRYSSSEYTVERPIAVVNTMGKAGRIQAPTAVAEPEIPKSTESLSGEACLRAIDFMDRSSSTSNSQPKCRCSGYYGRQSPLQVQGFLHPCSYSKSKNHNKERLFSSSCVLHSWACLDQVIWHASKDYKAIVQTRNVSWLDMEDARSGSWDRGCTI